jgi:signal transduction histidine kinase
MNEVTARSIRLKRLLVRSRRDVVVDVISIAICATAALVAASDAQLTDPWFAVRGLAVIVTLGLLLVRRSYPVAVVLVLILLSPLTYAISSAASIALLGLAVRRPAMIAAVVALLAWLVDGLQIVLENDSLLQSWVVRGTIIASGVINGLTIGIGLFIQMRRTLALSRAEQERKDQAQRVQQAREMERHRIAREMHDVLGHRISLMSVYAGALEYRAATLGPEVASSATIIRESAHQALQDLRQVVGVLRSAPEDEDGEAQEPQHPQPTLEDIDRLVDESRLAGTDVDLELRFAGPDEIPVVLGRTAYRVVQESLTNARKHAAGGKVRVVITGDQSAGLSIEVSNGPAHDAAAPDRIAGSGYGLVGLAERVQLLGGHLEHGSTSDGGFRLATRLPWPT